MEIVEDRNNVEGDALVAVGWQVVKVKTDANRFYVIAAVQRSYRVTVREGL